MRSAERLMSADLAASPAGQGPRLLVVDDDAQIRQVLVRLLEPLAAIVEEAASAEEALELLKGAPPDLVLLDVHLPGRQGHAVLEEIRSHDALRLLPVVMLSGDATRVDRLRAIRDGVTDFIHKPFDTEELLTRVQALLRVKAVTDTLEDAERVIVALARTIDARDPQTAGHSGRVSHYAGMLGERVGLPAQDLMALRQGCLFHDLGKIGVRDEVLFKPGRLTPEETEEMRRHPVVGRDLLQHMPSLQRALPVVYHHHEKCDGTGYPEGLARDSIPLIARVAALGDVYDGMTSPRPYRDAMTSAVALEIMAQEAKRGWWDPELFAEFQAVLETHPGGRAALASWGS